MRSRERCRPWTWFDGSQHGRAAPMATRIQPDEREKRRDSHPGMTREIAISRLHVGSDNLYSSVVRTPPGGTTRVHHHGPCETSIYVLSGRARFTFGRTG